MFLRGMDSGLQPKHSSQNGSQGLLTLLAGSVLPGLFQFWLLKVGSVPGGGKSPSALSRVLALAPLGSFGIQARSAWQF